MKRALTDTVTVVTYVLDNGPKPIKIQLRIGDTLPLNIRGSWQAATLKAVLKNGTISFDVRGRSEKFDPNDKGEVYLDIADEYVKGLGLDQAAATRVVIEELGDRYHLYDENGIAVESDFPTYASADIYARDNGFNVVNSFNL